jgi:hypothetical protein
MGVDLEILEPASSEPGTLHTTPRPRKTFKINCVIAVSDKSWQQQEDIKKLYMLQDCDWLHVGCYSEKVNGRYLMGNLDVDGTIQLMCVLQEEYCIMRSFITCTPHQT